MKNALSLLVLCSIIISAGIAGAVDVQTAPIEQIAPTITVPNNKPVTIGPRDPVKEKQRGVGVNVFLGKNMAVSGGVSLLSPEPSVLSGQPEQTGQAGGMSLNTSRVGGMVGLKLFF